VKHVAFGRNLTSLPGLLPLQTRRVTYLDTNAVSHLSRWQERAADITGIEEVRRDLCSSASKRTIALGQWFFSELAGFENGESRADFLADMAFVEQLQFLQIFRSSSDMRRLEVKAFLQGNKPNPVLVTWLPSTVDDPALWEAERRQLDELKVEYLAADIRGDERVEKWHPGRAARVKRLAPTWARNPHGIVRRWVRTQMRRHRVELGLPRDETHWPPPEKLLNLWCCWAYRVTRDTTREISMRSKTLKGSERRGSHAVDWCHYMTAAHADEFVTSDNGFLEIARAAPGPKPEILHLTEWVERLRNE
jgi:hypothetical protein